MGKQPYMEVPQGETYKNPIIKIVGICIIAIWVVVDLFQLKSFEYLFENRRTFLFMGIAILIVSRYAQIVAYLIWLVIVVLLIVSFFSQTFLQSPPIAGILLVIS